MDDPSPAAGDAASHSEAAEGDGNVDEPNPSAADAAGNTPASTRTPRHRGRHAKDPLGKSIPFKCQRTEELETSLREYLDAPTGDPEHTTLEFSFPVTTAFMVPKREPIGHLKPDKRIPYVYSPFNKTAVSVIDALHTIKDPKEQALVQRAISKTLVEAVERADGYRYSFHNHWLSREDQASRFSYYCNDSILNKGRAANEGASKIRNSVKIRKPVFECQGLLSIKFSVTKMTLELHYKHVPMHKTYEERAPPPRKDSKRRKLLEIFNPELLPALEENKRKRKSTPKAQSTRKRRATEPLPQGDTQRGPESPGDDSLQPLFDFLGSAGAVQDQTPDSSSPDRDPDATAPAVGPTVEESADLQAGKKAKKQPIEYPGMMSGFMSGEAIMWGRKEPAPLQRRRERGKRQSAPLPTGVSTSKPNAVVPATVLDPAIELERVRAQLQAAEQKIRDLEAEKSRPTPPISWNMSNPPLPPAGFSSQPYYPPHTPQHYPYTAPQWQYPPTQGSAPSGSTPGSQNHGPPPAQSVQAPTYGFVGGPLEPQTSPPAATAVKTLSWQTPLRVINTPSAASDPPVKPQTAPHTASS